MLEFLDGTDLHNRIRLLLRGGISTIVVVEGEDDYNLMIEAFEGTNVVIVPGYGKPKTIEAAKEAAEAETEPVRFLVDADFDRLTGAVEAYPPNVVASEHYDLAMDALGVVPVVITRIVRLSSGKTGTAALDVTNQVALTFRLAEEFGRVRYASHVAGWNLNFDGFPVHSYIPEQPDAQIDIPSVAELLVRRTGKCQLDPAVVSQTVPTYCARISNPRVLVNSHDLFRILLQVGQSFGAAKSNTGYETQFMLAAAGSVHEIPVVRDLLAWGRAA